MKKILSLIAAIVLTISMAACSNSSSTADTSGNSSSSSSDSESKGGKDDEYAWLKLRYKLPGASQSKLLEQAVAAKSKAFSAASSDSRFALAVTAYGEALRGGEYNGSLDWDDIRKLASGAQSPDPYGDRAEFIDLIEIAKSLSSRKQEN